MTDLNTAERHERALIIDFGSQVTQLIARQNLRRQTARIVQKRIKGARVQRHGVKGGGLVMGLKRLR